MEKQTGARMQRQWYTTTARAAILILAGLGLIVPVLFFGKTAFAFDMILVAPESSRSAPIPGGSLSQVMTMMTNDGEDAQPVPRLLDLVLTAEDGRTVQVAARILDETIESVPPGGYVRLAYGFEVPIQMAENLVSARVNRDGGNTVMFYAGLAEQPPVETLEEASVEPQPVTAMLPRFQPFFVNFYPYKPVYFLFGTDPGIQNTSFQISFKYKLFNFEQTENPSFVHRAFDRIYLAYTQQSFWDLQSDSAPFEDSRYMPEVFYYDDDLGLRLPWLIGSGLQVGLQHESNGRSGSNSRSTNYAYVQPSLIFKFTPSLHWLLAPKAWVYVRNDNDTNGDIADYRGYVDIESEFGDPKGFVLGSHLRWGKEGDSWQLDLSYPLNRIPGLEGMLDVYLHAQYYTGYSEQLLTYDRKEDIFRLGFSLVR